MSINTQIGKGKFSKTNVSRVLLTSIGVLGTGFAAGAMADTVTLNPTYDAYATAGDTGSFIGDLRVRDGEGAGANQIRSYMKFDLSSIPEGSTIVSATLKLWMTQAPTKQSGGPSVPTNASQNYVLYKSANVSWTDANDCLYDGAGTCTNPSAVPVSTNITFVATGTTPNVDLTWTHANLQSAVQGSLDAPAANNWISLVVSDDVASQYLALFSSNETATEVTKKPRLIVEYTPPAVTCLPGDEELRITRNDYTGPNPVTWVEASALNWWTITYTIEAICADITDIKVQGGIASNLGIETFDPDLGSVTPKNVGKGNKVLIWTIDQLNEGDEATLEFDVWAIFNDSNKAVCGVKNLTGDWSARGYWDDDGTPMILTDEVGKLVVDIGCPLP